MTLLINSTISLNYPLQSKGNAFVLVFMLFWLGCYIVNLNNRLLGLKSGVFQTICFLGYSLFPLNLSSFVFAFIPLHALLKLLVIFACIFWSIMCKLLYFKLKLINIIL